MVNEDFNRRSTEDVYNAFIAELRSGGSWKTITGVSMGYFNRLENGEFSVLVDVVDVNACLRSPDGESCDDKKSFRMKESELIMLAQALKEGRFELTDAQRSQGLTGLENIMKTLNKNIPEHIAGNRTMPDINTVTAAAGESKDLNL